MHKNIHVPVAHIHVQILRSGSDARAILRSTKCASQSRDRHYREIALDIYIYIYIYINMFVCVRKRR